MNGRDRTMDAHDQFRQLLALAAAGALDDAENSRLLAHLRECQDCAAELETWQALEAGLRRAPTPQAPAALVMRTIAVAQARMAQQSERRSQLRLIVLGIIFSWFCVALSWPVAQFASRGWMSLFGVGFAQGWENFAVFTALCWLAGAAAVIFLASRRERERRLA